MRASGEGSSGAKVRGSVRMVALGNPDRSDDGAALIVAERFRSEAEVILAGRPGLALLDYLPPDRVCLLLDVTVSGAPPGTIHIHSLEEVSRRVLTGSGVSGHSFGPAEALSLARSLGRCLPMGAFVGIEGGDFTLGEALSPPVERALPALEKAVRESLIDLSQGSSPQAWTGPPQG